MNKQARNDNEVITKPYIDQFHQENERYRRDLGINLYDESTDLVKKDQDNGFNDNKLTNLDSVKVNRNLTSNIELANKKYIDDSIGEGTIVKFKQTLQNYLKVSIGNDINNLTKYNKAQNVDTTIIKPLNIGGYLLQ